MSPPQILRLKSGAKLRLQSILLRRVHRLDSRVRDENKKRTSSQWGSHVGAVLYSDGGGKRAAALNPIRGANLRFFAGVGPQRPDARRHGGAARHSQRAPGFVLRESDGSIDTMAVEQTCGPYRRNLLDPQSG
jgi:hypothetical protein